MQFHEYKNFHEMLKETVDKKNDQMAYQWYLESWQPMSITWGQFYDQVRSVAKSLIALGVGKNDKVSVLSYSNYRWILTDAAAMTCGAVTVGVYHSNLPKDCQYIIDHSDSVLVFVEDELQLGKVLEIRESIPDIKKVILMKGSYSGDDWVVTYDDFIKIGTDVAEAELEKRIDDVHSEDVSGIVYTSGTTGVPKGAELTHDNVTFTAQSVMGSTYILDGDHMFLFLPLPHVFARTTVYSTIKCGGTTTINRDMDTLIETFQRAKPHWFPSVPRIYEKVYTKVMSGAEAKGGLAYKIFKWALSVGYKVSDLKVAKKPIPKTLEIQYNLATKLVFSKIQAALGGRVRWCISGAAPLNKEIARFFHAAGVQIVEGIGMTENMSFSHLNRYDNYKFGTVGPPGPGVEHKIADDGELLIRGRNVMKGYYKMPEETAKDIDADGWLHTGDEGMIDSDNFLSITGRKKDIIITAGGKNVAPALLEGVLGTSKYISQICVVGDQQKYLAALIAIEPDNVMDYADENGIAYETADDLIKNDKVVALIEGVVKEMNKEFASYETIKKITLVPEFTIENGMLTPTLKLKKNIAVKQFASEIDAMFPKV